jgi:TetR/AcrR family transcriptional regulator, lmrAB and yxaGH operons repressor
MDRASARELAEVVVSGVEGALVTARAFHNPAPFNSMLAVLVNHAARLGSPEVRDQPDPEETGP